jgi:uncharacterized protein (DUF2236 family)
MRPAWAVLGFTTVGLLPDPIRRGYGLGWTPAHSAAHAALRLSVRTMRPALPRRMRVSPVHGFAMERVLGRTAAAGEIG